VTRTAFQLGFHFQRAPLPNAERIGDIFKQLDATGDGQLSFIEIKRGLEENDIDWVRRVPVPPPPHQRTSCSAGCRS